MPNLSASSLPCIGRSKTSSRRRAPGPGSALPRTRSGVALNRQFLPRPVGCQLFISPRPASPSSFSASSAIATFLRSSLACIAISVLDSLLNLSATRQAAWDSVRISLRAPEFILALQLIRVRQQNGRCRDNAQAPAAIINNAIRTIKSRTVTLKEGRSLSHELVCRDALSLTIPDIALGVAVFFIGELILSRLLYQGHLRDKPY